MSSTAKNEHKLKMIKNYLFSNIKKKKRNTFRLYLIFINKKYIKYKYKHNKNWT